MRLKNNMERKNKVYYSQDLKKPMIKLSNNFLKECGFWVGDSILVTYEQNKIIIVKEVNENGSN